MGLKSSTIISIVYASLLTIFLIVTGYIATKRLHHMEFKRKSKNITQKWDELSVKKKVKEWLNLVYKLRSVYISGLIHIYDTATDIIIIIEWSILANKQWKWNKSDGDYPNSRLSMLGLTISSVIAFSLYRFISGYLVYKYTKKPHRFFTQFFDLELFRAIHIAHYLERDSVIDLQRWLQKLEAIFESAPQALLQIVYLTLSDESIRLSRNSIIIASSLIFSLISISQRFTNDDKVFFNDNKGALAHIKLKNLLLSHYIRFLNFGKKLKIRNLRHDIKFYILYSKWHKKCINFEYVERYLFRITDVFSRIIILSLIWIIFPSGGFCLMVLLFVECCGILVWVILTDEYNKLQLLVATYFAEFVEIKENNNEQIEDLKASKLRSAKFSFWRRIENLVLLLICIARVFFDSRYFQYKAWVNMSKVLLLLAIITNSISASLYFFTHHNMTENLKSTTGTNERNLVKVIEHKDPKTFLEMLLFGFYIGINPVKINSDIKIETREDKKEREEKLQIEEKEESVVEDKNDEIISNIKSFMESKKVEEEEESEAKYDNINDEIISNVDTFAKTSYERKESVEIELEDINSNEELYINDDLNDDINKDKYLTLHINNIFLLFFWKLRDTIIEYKDESLITTFLLKGINIKLRDIQLLLTYYVPSTIDGLKYMFNTLDNYIKKENSTWRECFDFHKQKRMFKLAVEKYNNNRNWNNQLAQFYIKCCKNNKYNFEFTFEFLNGINGVLTSMSKNVRIKYDKYGEITTNITMNDVLLEYGLSIEDMKPKSRVELNVFYLDINNQKLDRVTKSDIIDFKLIKANDNIKFICINSRYYAKNYLLAQFQRVLRCPGQHSSKSKQPKLNNKQMTVEREIRAHMKADYKDEKKLNRILLFGPPDSGKNRFLLQLKRISFGRLEYQELLHSVPFIRRCVINTIVTLCRQSINLAKKDLKTSVSDKLIDKRNYFLQQVTLEDNGVIPNGDYIVDLWKDSGIKKTFGYRSLYFKYMPIATSASHFLDKAETINEEDYVPSYEDYLLWIHRPSACQYVMWTTEVQGQRVPFEIVSLTGHGKTKQLHLIADGMKALIYMFSIGDYDKYVFNDTTKINRLHEALSLFKQILQYFKHKTVTVFLNKYDLFCETLKSKPITIAFDDFPSDNDPKDRDQVTHFIMGKFQTTYNNSVRNNSTLVMHCTSALDFDNVDRAFYDVTVEIVKQNIENFNLH